MIDFFVIKNKFWGELSSKVLLCVCFETGSAFVNLVIFYSFFFLLCYTATESEIKLVEPLLNFEF